MAWEKRGNRKYYYRKIREDGRVRSIYWGRGDNANFMAERVAGDPLGRLLAAQLDHAHRAEAEGILSAIETLEEHLRHVTGLALIAAGFHQHKGQWRKQHEKK